MKRFSKKIEEILEDYFPNPKIPLDHVNAYTFLIAVLLSAQCQDKRVNVATKTLFALADSPQKMISLGKEKVKECIKSLGLTDKKADAIIKLSKILIEKHEGEVPASFEELEALPLVGHKTASCVMAQMFDKPAFPVDTHIFRLARRWGLSKGTTPEKVESDLKKLFPKKKWNLIHLQMVYFGRAFCKARGHIEEECPICTLLNSSRKLSGPGK